MKVLTLDMHFYVEDHVTIRDLAFAVNNEAPTMFAMSDRLKETLKSECKWSGVSYTNICVIPASMFHHHQRTK